MAVAYIPDHTAQALARLLEQNQGPPTIASLITAICSNVQAFENQAFPVLGCLNLYGGTAYGAQLDLLGQIVGLARNGLPDPQYQLVLQGAVSANNSKGDNETVIGIIEACFEAVSASVNSGFSPGHAHARASAVVSIEVGSPSISPALYSLVLGIVQRSLGAGIALSWASTYADGACFALAGGDAGIGFADLNVPGSGGQLASLIYSNTVA